jgi:hypothetical protein
MEMEGWLDGGWIARETQPRLISPLRTLEIISNVDEMLLAPGLGENLKKKYSCERANERTHAQPVGELSEGGGVLLVANTCEGWDCDSLAPLGNKRKSQTAKQRPGKSAMWVRGGCLALACALIGFQGSNQHRHTRAARRAANGDCSHRTAPQHQARVIGSRP